MRGALSQHTCGRPVFYAFSLGIGGANDERRSDNRRSEGLGQQGSESESRDETESEGQEGQSTSYLVPMHASIALKYQVD